MQKFYIRVMNDDGDVIFHATARDKAAAIRIAMARYPDAHAVGVDAAYQPKIPQVAVGV